MKPGKSGQALEREIPHAEASAKAAADRLAGLLAERAALLGAS